MRSGGDTDEGRSTTGSSATVADAASLAIAAAHRALENMGLLLALLRVYLVLASAFELVNLWSIRQLGATRSSAVLRELVGGGRNADERRGLDLLWSSLLWNLAAARAALAYDPYNTTLFALVTSMHVAEAGLFALAVPVTKLRAEHWSVVAAAVQAAVLLVAWAGVALL